MWVTIVADFDNGVSYTRHTGFSEALKRANSLALEFIDMRIESPRKKNFHWVSDSGKGSIFIEQYTSAREKDKILFFYGHAFPKHVSSTLRREI